MNKKVAAVMLTAALVLPTLAACTKTNKEDNETERTLRIAAMNYGLDDSYFRQQFTEVFEFANPKIKVEIVPVTENDKYMYVPPKPGEKQEDPLVKLKEKMQAPNPPDVVVVDYSQLADLIENNMLAPLDNLITKDKFDIAGIVPAVVDGVKALGNGALYGLAPTFSSSALVYNKKLFQEAGVEFPKDDMTWDEVFELARRVTKPDGDKPRYGFNFYSNMGGDLFYSTQTYTQSLQLNMFDDKGEKMTVDSDGWEKVWKTLIQLEKDKVIPPPPDYSKMKSQSADDYNPFMNDAFMSGQLAMTLMDYSQLMQIYNANKNAENIKGYTPIEWDAVTMPSHPEAKGMSSNVYLNGLMAINAKAGNPDDAWKFVKFVNGEDWAKLRSGSSYQLVSRKKYIKSKVGDFHIEAYTNIKPLAGENQFNKLGREKPGIYQVQGIGQNEFQQALEGKKSVRDALKAWQTQGDTMLQQLKDNPNGGNQMFQGRAMAVPVG